MANSDATPTSDEDSSESHEATLQEICRQVLGDRRLVISSNRGPVTYEKDDSGELVAQRGSGGVVTALSSLTNITPLTWVAAALSEADREISGMEESARPQALEDGDNLRLRFVNIDVESFDKYLNVISNPLLWFTQHEMNDLLLEDRESNSELWVAWREGYVKANREFARVVAEEVDLAESAPYTIFHDYQLYLAPGMLRQHHPDLTMMHFTHIPWPNPETWRALPRTWVRSICEALLACDIVGFQTNSAVEAFAATCQQYVQGVRTAKDKQGYTQVFRTTGQDKEEVTWVRAYPISVDPQEVVKVYQSFEADEWKAKLQAELGDYDKLIVRVDRLDPNKNVVVGFESYQQLLQDRPDLVGKVVFLALLVPTRESVPEYAQYKDQTFELIDQINADFGRKSWRPIHYIYGNDYARALAALSMADVVLVNSVADGMNLVAKEGVIVSEKPSVLVLSNNTGAWEELGEHSIGVAPDDLEGTAKALAEALEMPEAEKKKHHQALDKIVRENDLSHWLASHLSDLGRFQRKNN